MPIALDYHDSQPFKLVIPNLSPLEIPMKNLPACVVLGFIFSLQSGLAAQESSKAPAASISDLAWMAGNWSSEEGGQIVEEQWLAPRAGMMVGVNRTSFPNGKGTFEFLRIAETGSGLTYFASPSGKPATPFLIKSIEETKVIFENLANDFPHRIIYAKSGDALTASIEGEIKGQRKSMNWIWKRVPLPK